MILLHLRKDPSSYSACQRNAENMICAFAKGERCTLLFENGEEFDFSYRLKQLQILVSFSGKFLRVHQSCLVRMDAISGCRWGSLRLVNGTSIRVSRKMSPVLQDWFMVRGTEEEQALYSFLVNLAAELFV